MSKFQQAVFDNNPAGAHSINFCIGLIHLWIWITYWTTFWAEIDALIRLQKKKADLVIFFLSSFYIFFNLLLLMLSLFLLTLISRVNVIYITEEGSTSLHKIPIGAGNNLLPKFTWFPHWAPKMTKMSYGYVPYIIIIIVTCYCC